MKILCTYKQKEKKLIKVNSKLILIQFSTKHTRLFFCDRDKMQIVNCFVSCLKRKKSTTKITKGVELVTEKYLRTRYKNK